MVFILKTVTTWPVDRINSMGGVKVGGKTYKFEIIYYDDESNPKRAAQLAERLIKQDGVEYMLGPYSSGLTKAIAPVTEKYGVPMVEANGAFKIIVHKRLQVFVCCTCAS
jgi:branched-chain amino acid transport system substrate-binding protein